MKNFATILAIYLLIGMFIPCTDADNLRDLDQDTISYLAVNHPDQHQQTPDTDFCSALCSCHCCHSHITFGFLENNLSELVACAKLTSLTANAISEHSYSIWQPPKV